MVSQVQHNMYVVALHLRLLPSVHCILLTHVGPFQMEQMSAGKMSYADLFKGQSGQNAAQMSRIVSVDLGSSYQSNARSCSTSDALAIVSIHLAHPVERSPLPLTRAYDAHRRDLRRAQR
jgi:hypothetical protein